MFITICTFRTKSGCEEYAVALYQELRRVLRQAPGYVSGELLVNAQDTRDFLSIARFEDEETAWAVAEIPEQRALYARLVGLTDVGPIVGYWREQRCPRKVRSDR